MTPRPGGAVALAPWILAGAGFVLALCLAVTNQPRPCASTPIITSTQAEAPHLLVNGIATIEVVPDVLDVTVQLALERASPRDAVQALRAEQDALIAALNADGFSGESLRVSHSGVSPVYETIAGTSRIRGFEASVSLVICVQDFDRVGEVLERVAGFELRHLSTHFRSTKIAEKKRELRAMALEAARAKAEQSATLMGVQLAEVLSIEETQRNDSPGWGSLANFAANEYVATGASAEPSMPGAVSLSLAVEVGYALRQ
ncbi:MAG: SIMPL domain-containing protein [Myxococcales bacterium]|nr:SIMPL domain-containing protein [Myxococcales bacterium]